ncbi:hypothetical protein FBU30_007023 [Linnemannia zychae]|nr:hypothetical protein FBU30_007023 [Linnemannia zychae]
MRLMALYKVVLFPLLRILLLSLFLLPYHPAHGDVKRYYIPTPVYGAAYVRALTELYIVGGATGANPGLRIQQFMSLDLNVDWNTTSPAWTKHADGPRQDIFPAALSADEKKLYVFHIPDSSSPFQWDSATDTWTELVDVKFDNATWQGIGAVTDPGTGLIYFAGGYNDDSNLSNDLTDLAVDIFDPVVNSLNRTHFKLHEGTFLAKLYYGNVWRVSGEPRIYAVCTVAGDQLIVWGGRANDFATALPNLLVYNMVTKTWVNQYTPPASYRDIKDPLPLNRTTALWPITGRNGKNSQDGPVTGTSKTGVIVGGVVAGILLIAIGVGIAIYRRRHQLTRTQQAEIEHQHQGTRSQKSHQMNQLLPSEENELQQTLNQLQELENQQSQLEQKKQELFTQKQQHVPYPIPPTTRAQHREPLEYLEPLSDYRSSPHNPEFVGQSKSSDFITPETVNLGDLRTVQNMMDLSSSMANWDSHPSNNPQAILDVGSSQHKQQSRTSSI